MRIGMVGSLPESIPPQKYGGTERVIYHLVEGLVKRGHDVTLFASGDSTTSAKLVSVVDKALRKTNIKDIYGFNTYSTLNIGVAYEMQDQFDIIHDHNPHLSLPTANLAKVPVVMTWHGPFGEDITKLFAELNRPYVVSISKSQQPENEDVNFLGNVYNGLPMQHYPFGAQPRDYLLYVGRIDAEKGTHIAIDAAVKLNKKLVIAAKYDSEVPHIKEYFEGEIKPRLDQYVDLVNWVGEVDELQRNELMKNALCLVHPITWPEPFGLAIIEAMACGCPVVANDLGSMREIIIHGRTGYIVENFEGLLEAIRNIDKINRAYCREYSLNNFSDDRMVEGYIKVYKKALILNKLGIPNFNASQHKNSRLFPQFSFGDN